MPPKEGTKHLDLLNDYVSKEQIAATFEISERTIERWVRLRRFPAPLKLGRKRLYQLSAIRKYLEGLVQGQRCSRQPR